MPTGSVRSRAPNRRASSSRCASVSDGERASTAVYTETGVDTCHHRGGRVGRTHAVAQVFVVTTHREGVGNRHPACAAGFRVKRRSACHRVAAGSTAVTACLQQECRRTDDPQGTRTSGDVSDRWSISRTRLSTGVSGGVRCDNEIFHLECSARFANAWESKLKLRPHQAPFVRFECRDRRGYSRLVYGAAVGAVAAIVEAAVTPGHAGVAVDAAVVAWQPSMVRLSRDRPMRCRQMGVPGHGYARGARRGRCGPRRRTESICKPTDK
jgi:hypothetical protein